MRNQVVVASISPWKAGISRPQFIPVADDDKSKGGQYWIKAVPKGARPEVLVIGDAYQAYRAPITGYEARETITALQIAEDLVTHMTTNAPFMGPDCHPAVWICERTVAPPGEDIWTPEELTRAHRVTSNYMLARIQRANELFTDPHKVPLINAEDRMAATWLGRKPEWLNPPSDLDVIACPYCRKTVPTLAALCEGCGKVVNPVLFAQLEAQTKLAIKNAKEVEVLA